MPGLFDSAVVTIGLMTDEVARAREAAPRRSPRVSPLGPVLALDFGGTQTRAAAVAADGTVLERTSARTPLGDGQDAVVQLWVESLRRVRSAVRPADQAALVGIGISAPGPLDATTGTLIDPPNLPADFRGLAIADLIAGTLGLPAFLERDTHVAALGEWWFGAARGLSDFIYLTVSTGVGGAVVTGGSLMTGPDGVAGELGHLPVDLDGPQCGCGARGHLEATSSGTGIANAAGRASGEGRVTPGSFLAERARAVAPASIQAVDVAAAEEAGDAVAAEIMEYARQSFAAAMVGVVDVFNPERIIVGGSVARGQGERWLTPAREQVERHAFRVAGRRVRIVPAELGDDVSLIGAVPLVAAALARLHSTPADASPAAQSPATSRKPDGALSHVAAG